MTALDDEGAIVEAEFIRPDWWIEENRIAAGELMPLAIEELGLSGYATIQTVEDCGPIARGDGSVVTGRFTTSRVNVIVRLTVAGPDGTTEVLEGTTVHPIWSVDRNDWIQLSELQEGETLQATDGIATVASIAIVSTNVPVYNIEVHGEHVYQVGELSTLVHNSDLVCRIGGGKVDNLLMSAAEEGLTPPGISVILANSADEAALAMRNAFPHAKALIKKSSTIGSTTAEQIRDAGYKLLFKPSNALPTHHRVYHPDGIDAFNSNIERLASIFVTTIGH